MRKYLFLLLVLIPVVALGQRKLGTGVLSGGAGRNAGTPNDTLDGFGTRKSTANVTPVAPVDWYKIISIKRDTISIDTTLTIKKEYKSNYLRRDLFGLLPLPNEGQTYNVLDFGLTNFDPYPTMGFKAKHFGYMEAEDIKYYHVPTPMSDLHYKSVMEQGQMLDAFIALNTSKNLNFSVGYKGIRSIGKYINSISSNGNFRLTSSYKTDSLRYVGNYHVTAQDFENGENGGIVNLEDFESGRSPFTERARLEVFYRDAKSFLKGKRFFTDQTFRINKDKVQNNIAITHRFIYENKEFSFSQYNPHERLGSTYVINNIHDKTKYNRMYNRFGAIYQNETFGDLTFFVDDLRQNYYYNRATLSGGEVLVPNKISQTVNTIGGQYEYYKNNWRGVALLSRSLSDNDLSNLDVSARYTINDENSLHFRYQNINKLPDLNYNLYQSNYVGYNWSNNFKNQKINNIEVEANLKWVSASMQLSNLNDYLFFSNDAFADNKLITTPKQYDKSISYLGVKVSKEFKVGKFALDNTILYQEVAQDHDILNVPQFVTRNTLYYTDYVFKKAMRIQTGFSFNYFSKYYANDYNGVIGEFYVQNHRKIGDFPVIDFFINAKISTAQIYLKAEHFNSSFTGYNFYSTPNQPYRDFIIRFGILWNFFS